MKRRWSESESESSELTSSSESGDHEPLSPHQLEYLEIGKQFLERSGLSWWFAAFDEAFNFASDCNLSIESIMACPCHPTRHHAFLDLRQWCGHSIHGTRNAF